MKVTGGFSSHGQAPWQQQSAQSVSKNNIASPNRIHSRHHLQQEARQ
jgi:hypothetical protein